MDTALQEALDYYKHLIQRHDVNGAWLAFAEEGTVVVVFDPADAQDCKFTARLIAVSPPTPDGCTYYVLFIWGARFNGAIGACTAENLRLDYFAKLLLDMSSNKYSGTGLPPHALHAELGALFCHPSNERPERLEPASLFANKAETNQANG